jgi:hypothetical protein
MKFATKNPYSHFALKHETQDISWKKHIHRMELLFLRNRNNYVI